VSIGLFGRFLRSVIARPARAAIAVIATLGISACSNGSVSGPEGAHLIGNLDGRAVGPLGLEQRLVTRLDPAPAGSPYTALLSATSTLVNTGAAPVRVKARVCFVQESDVETTASMDRFEPLVSCAADNMETDLAPGQSIGPLEVQFGVRSGPGEYKLEVRHALAPEFRAGTSFRIP
jgi:hypothetical protein